MSKLQELHTMSSPLLNEIAQRLYSDIAAVENAGEQKDWERLPALQMTLDSVIAELAERDAAAQWHAEYLEYAEAMASASQDTFDCIHGVTEDQAYDILAKRGVDVKSIYVEQTLDFEGPGKITFSREDPASHDIDIGVLENGTLTLYN